MNQDLRGSKRKKDIQQWMFNMLEYLAKKKTCWSKEYDVSLSTADYWVYIFDFLLEISSVKIKTFKDVLEFCMACLPSIFSWRSSIPHHFNFSQYIRCYCTAILAIIVFLF